MAEAAIAPHESESWGLDVELEAMESKQTDFSLSLYLLPEHLHHTDSPVEFLYYYLCPTRGTQGCFLWNGGGFIHYDV